jgi:hypothetical protein
MTKFAITALAALTLLQPVRSDAGEKPADSRAKPASYVPRARTNRHVYGTPISPAIVGHGKTSHRNHPPKK